MEAIPERTAEPVMDVEPRSSTPPADSAYAEREWAPLGRRTLTDHLADHWLWQMVCDHEANTDVAYCACGLWSSGPQPSVGAAARKWAEHAIRCAFLPPFGRSEATITDDGCSSAQGEARSEGIAPK